MIYGFGGIWEWVGFSAGNWWPLRRSQGRGCSPGLARVRGERESSQSFLTSAPSRSHWLVSQEPVNTLPFVAERYQQAGNPEERAGVTGKATGWQVQEQNPGIQRGHGTPCSETAPSVLTTSSFAAAIMDNARNPERKRACWHRQRGSF